MLKNIPMHKTAIAAAISIAVAFIVAKWFEHAYSTNFGAAFLVTFFGFILLTFQFLQNDTQR